MKIFSTFDLTDTLISKALKTEEYPSPSVSSLEMIKNFAYNFRVKKCTDEISMEYSLN